MLARMEFPTFPQPVGIFRDVQRDTYEDLLAHQIEEAVARQGRGQLRKLIHSGDMWVVD
jgi:2-oxoglutarate ferredoxin oxidoreductase subunit beta